MNWLIGIAVLAAMFVGGWAIDTWWRRRQQKTLPKLDDDAFRAECPEGLEPDLWVATRTELAECLELEPDCLLPDASLETLSKHFQLMGLPGIDLDGVYEIRLGHLEPKDFDGLSTVGDLIVLMARNPEPEQ